MDRPRRVLDLSRQLGIPTEDVLLQCNFCGKFLTTSDLLSFDYKGLQLIWKDSFVFGSCTACLRATAIYEWMCFCEGQVIGSQLERVTQKGLAEIAVRCRYCLKKLDLLEKLDICAKRKEFYKVREYWRGVCRHCVEVE